MKVAIIGGGAIGLLFAANLTRNSVDTSIYCRTNAQSQLLNESGLTLLKEDHSYQSSILSKPFHQFKGEEDIFIVTVKQYDLDDVIGKLKDMESGKHLLFLQNGMSHIEKLTELNHHNRYIGIVEHGALRHSMNMVEHTGRGTTRIAPFDEISVEFEKFILGISTLEFPFLLEKEWYEMVSKKMLVNAVINPLTTLYNVQNGFLLSPPFLENTKMLFEEVFSILPLKDKQQCWATLVDICQKTSKNYSSMLKDVRSGRETELDAILGYLMRVASKNDKKVPLVHFLYNSIQGIQEWKGRETN